MAGQTDISSDEKPLTMRGDVGAIVWPVPVRVTVGGSVQLSRTGGVDVSMLGDEEKRALWRLLREEEPYLAALLNDCAQAFGSAKGRRSPSVVISAACGASAALQSILRTGGRLRQAA